MAVAVNCCVAPTAKLTGLGVMAIDFKVGVGTVTTNVAVPTTLFSVAVTVVVPTATAVARPKALTVTTAVFAEVHVAVVVTFAVVPSLYVAVAVNCCVPPAARLTGLGVTAIEVTVGPAAAVIVTVAVELFIPLYEADIVIDPAATAVTRPVALIVATAGFEDVQVTVPEMFAIDP